MSNSNNNQINVPQAREAMDKFKMQVSQDCTVSTILAVYCWSSLIFYQLTQHSLTFMWAISEIMTHRKYISI